tara:strand:+ start:19 stop:795 length:777 start_codon:yes stop_codon:yes gene_type:complete
VAESNYQKQARLRDSFNSKYRGGMGSTNQAKDQGININAARQAGISLPNLNQQVMKMNATDYGRPMNVSGFNDKLDLYNRFQNRGDQVIKDSQGRSIVGMQMPNLTMQQPTGSQVMGDIRRRLNQDAQNYGGGIMSMLANMALPGAGTFMNMMQGAGNGMQGGMQKLIDYRPQMNQPREGVMGGIDQLFNLGKGMIGGKNYDRPQASLPVINNNTNMADSGTHPLMPMFMNIQNQTGGGGFENFEEFLDVYFNQSMLS